MAGNIRAVVFDYGGVLSLSHDRETLQRMVAMSGLSPDTFRSQYLLHRPDYDRGTVDGLTYWARVLGRSDSDVNPEPKPDSPRDPDPDPELLERLVEHDIRSWTRVNRTTVSWALSLRRDGYRLAILSNMVPECLDYMRKTFDWLRDFDVTVFSCELGMIKPERRIYEICLDELGVPASETLFIDDSEKNVGGAVEAGINGMTFVDTDQALRDARERYNLPVN